MGIKLHPRTSIVEAARAGISREIMRQIRIYDLTSAELISIYSHMLSVEAKYVLRDERHPTDKDKKADEA